MIFAAKGQTDFCDSTNFHYILIVAQMTLKAKMLKWYLKKGDEL